MSPALESEAPEVVEPRIGMLTIQALYPPRSVNTLVSPLFGEPAEKIPTSPKFQSLPIPITSLEKGGLPEVHVRSLKDSLYRSSHRLDRCVKEKRKGKTILGLQSWIFWTVVGILLVALAIGGLAWGIIGVYNLRRKNDG